MKILTISSLLFIVLASSMWASKISIPTKKNSDYGVDATIDCGDKECADQSSMNLHSFLGGSIEEQTLCSSSLFDSGAGCVDSAGNRTGENAAYVFVYQIDQSASNLTLTGLTAFDSTKQTGFNSLDTGFFGAMTCEEDFTKPVHPLLCVISGDFPADFSFNPGSGDGKFLSSAGDIDPEPTSISLDFNVNPKGLAFYVEEDSTTGVPSIPLPCLDGTCAAPVVSPEPGSFALLGSALLAAFWVGRRRFGASSQTKN